MTLVKPISCSSRGLASRGPWILAGRQASLDVRIIGRLTHENADAAHLRSLCAYPQRQRHARTEQAYELPPLHSILRHRINLRRWSNHTLGLLANGIRDGPGSLLPDAGGADQAFALRGVTLAGFAGVVDLLPDCVSERGFAIAGCDLAEVPNRPALSSFKACSTHPRICDTMIA